MGMFVFLPGRSSTFLCIQIVMENRRHWVVQDSNDGLKFSLAIGLVATGTNQSRLLTQTVKFGVSVFLFLDFSMSNAHLANGP